MLVTAPPKFDYGIGLQILTSAVSAEFVALQKQQAPAVCIGATTDAKKGHSRCSECL